MQRMALKQQAYTVNIANAHINYKTVQSQSHHLYQQQKSDNITHIQAKIFRCTFIQTDTSMQHLLTQVCCCSTKCTASLKASGVQPTVKFAKLRTLEEGTGIPLFL